MRSLFQLALVAIAICGLFPIAVGAQSKPVRDKNVEAQLISTVTTIKPGEPFTLALRLKIDPTWHTYWINAGDAGFPPKLTLELPDGFTATKLEFVVPKKFIVDYGYGVKMVGFGYEHEAIHPLTITPPASLKLGETVTIKAKTKWLMCDPNTCIPGKADLSIDFKVGENAAQSMEALIVNKVIAQVPKRKSWKTMVSLKGDSVEVKVELPDGVTIPEGEMSFFPVNSNVFDLLKEPVISRQGNNIITVNWAKHESLKELPDPFSGLLAVESDAGKTGFLISTADLAVEKAESAPSKDLSNAGTSQSGLPFGGSLAGILLAAFLGGIILNIMPCVLPVISLKIMSFVNQAGEDRKKTLMHSLIFTLGILVFFWVLTGILLAMRSAGSADIGWGVQMRQPAFVLGLIFVMVLVALSLFGVVEFGTSLTGVGGNLANKSGYAGSFWNGALAVLMATPCIGPLMAPAIAFALVQSAPIAIAVFTALGLGLAAPYLLIGAFPKLISAIPSPGPWMDSFKQAMGFPMLAAAIWLTGVLSGQLTTAGLQWALISVLLLAIAAWVLGRFVRPDSSPSSRTKGRIVAILLVVGGIILAVDAKNLLAPASDTDISGLIEEHRAAGKNVFVDFTADWCMTCKVNEAIAINTEKVQQAFKDNNIEFVVADWSKPNPQIPVLLKKFGRIGIPLYVIYPADQSKAPIVLKDGFITPTDVLEALAKLPRK